MSYFNEPARLAMLNIMGEINKEPTTDKVESKGLLSRTNGTSNKSSSQKSVSEIEKLIRYSRNIKAEMRKHKNAV